MDPGTAETFNRTALESIADVRAVLPTGAGALRPAEFEALSASAFDAGLGREPENLMVHSVELLFDPDTEAAVRQIWDGAAPRRGCRARRATVRRPTARTLTLAVSERIDPAGRRRAARRRCAWLPLDCRLGAPMLFGAQGITLVRLVVPSAELLALHEIRRRDLRSRT